MNIICDNKTITYPDKICTDLSKLCINKNFIYCTPIIECIKNNTSICNKSNDFDMSILLIILAIPIITILFVGYRICKDSAHDFQNGSRFHRIINCICGCCNTTFDITKALFCCNTGELKRMYETFKEFCKCKKRNRQNRQNRQRQRQHHNSSMIRQIRQQMNNRNHNYNHSRNNNNYSNYSNYIRNSRRLQNSRHSSNSTRNHTLQTTNNSNASSHTVIIDEQPPEYDIYAVTIINMEPTIEPPTYNENPPYEDLEQTPPTYVQHL